MQAAKVTDNKFSEFLGIRNLISVVADPVTGRIFRKTLVKTLIMNADGPLSLAADSILRDIIIIPTQPINVKVGTSAGSDDLVVETLVGVTGALLSFNQYIRAATQIHLSGLAPGTEIKLIIF